jgi:hypothetical protein
MHWIDAQFVNKYDHLKSTLVDNVNGADYGLLLTANAQNLTGTTRWGQIFNAKHYVGQGTLLAEHIVAELNRPDGALFCVINEISTPTSPDPNHVNTQPIVYDAALSIGFGFGGQWGAYVVAGGTVDYWVDIESQLLPNFTPPTPRYLMGQIFYRGGWVFPEIYIGHMQYLSPGGGDAYVRTMIDGGGSGSIGYYRTAWLEGYRLLFAGAYTTALASLIVPVMGVSNRWLGNTGGTTAQPARLLDRIWFVGATMTTYQYLWTTHTSSGGPASYLWAGGNPPPPGEGLVTPDDRDEVFGASHRWYAQGRNRHSRLGAV